MENHFKWSLTKMKKITYQKNRVYLTSQAARVTMDNFQDQLEIIEQRIANIENDDNLLTGKAYIDAFLLIDYYQKHLVGRDFTLTNLSCKPAFTKDYNTDEKVLNHMIILQKEHIKRLQERVNSLKEKLNNEICICIDFALDGLGITTPCPTNSFPVFRSVRPRKSKKSKDTFKD